MGESLYLDDLHRMLRDYHRSSESNEDVYQVCTVHLLAFGEDGAWSKDRLLTLHARRRRGEPVRLKESANCPSCIAAVTASFNAMFASKPSKGG